MKDIRQFPQLLDQEMGDIQTLLNGVIMRPGERVTALLLLDISATLKQQITLLQTLVEQTKPAKIEAVKIEAGKDVVSKRATLEQKG